MGGTRLACAMGWRASQSPGPSIPYRPRGVSVSRPQIPGGPHTRIMGFCSKMPHQAPAPALGLSLPGSLQPPSVLPGGRLQRTPRSNDLQMQEETFQAPCRRTSKGREGAVFLFKVSLLSPETPNPLSENDTARCFVWPDHTRYAGARRVQRLLTGKAQKRMCESRKQANQLSEVRAGKLEPGSHWQGAGSPQ